jgi:triacylglycerol lipase
MSAERQPARHPDLPPRPSSPANAVTQPLQPRGASAERAVGWSLTEVAGYLDVPRSLRPPIWRELLPTWPDPTSPRPAAPPRTASPRTVLLVPGFLATDATTAGLAAALRHAGHHTHRARLETTNGCSERLTSELVTRLDQLATTSGQPITVIGHSRGGLIAKAATQRRSDLVDGLITLGTPLTDPWGLHLSLKLLIAAISRAGRYGAAVGTCGDPRCPYGDCSTQFFHDLDDNPAPHIEFTSVYSRRDGITQWRTCLHPGAHHLEVDCRHLDMTTNPTVHAELNRLLNPAPRADVTTTGGGR